MPKVEKTQRDHWAVWKGMVLQAKESLQLSDEDIAVRLNGAGVRGAHCAPLQYGRHRKVCRQTVTRWRKDPDTMPLWAFARINRILEIEAATAREAVVVWR